jgi:hypothetical protein
MIADYSEITAKIYGKTNDINAALEQKRFEDAQQLIHNLQNDLQILQMWIWYKNQQLTDEYAV